MSIKRIPVAAATALAILAGSAAAAELDATLVPAGVERAGRGVYDLIFDVNLANNSGQPQQHLSAELHSTDPATEIIDGALNLPALDAGGSAEGADQVRVRQAYRTRFRPGNLQLTVTGGAPVAGQYRLKSGRAAFIERMAVEEAILRHGIAAVLDQLPEIKQRLDQRAVDLGTTLDADEHRELLLRLLQFLPGQLAFDRTDATRSELQAEFQALRDQKLTEDLSGAPLPPPVVGADYGWARSFDEIGYGQEAAAIAWTQVAARAPELRTAVLEQVDADLADMTALSIANARPLFLGSQRAMRGHLQIVGLHAATLGLDDDIGPYDTDLIDSADDTEALRYLLHIRLADYHRNAGHLEDAHWVAHCERGGDGFSVLRTAPSDPHYHHDGLCHGALMAMTFPVALPDGVVSLPDDDPDNPALIVSDSDSVPTNQEPALRTLYGGVADGDLTVTAIGSDFPYADPGDYSFQIESTTWLVSRPESSGPEILGVRWAAPLDQDYYLESIVPTSTVPEIVGFFGDLLPSPPDSRSYDHGLATVNLDSDLTEEIIIAADDHLCLLDVPDLSGDNYDLKSCTQLPSDSIDADRILLQVAAVPNFDTDGSATVIVAKSPGTMDSQNLCKPASTSSPEIYKYKLSLQNGFERDTSWGNGDSGLSVDGASYIVLTKQRSKNPMFAGSEDVIVAMRLAYRRSSDIFGTSAWYRGDGYTYHAADGFFKHADYDIYSDDLTGDDCQSGHADDYLNSPLASSRLNVWANAAYTGTYNSAYAAAGPAKTYHFAGKVLAMLDPPPCTNAQSCTSTLETSSTETTKEAYTTGHARTQSWSVEVKVKVGKGAGVIAGAGYETSDEVKHTTTDTSQVGRTVSTGMTVKTGGGQAGDSIDPVVKAQTLIRTVQPFTVLASVSRPDYNGQVVNLVTQRAYQVMSGGLSGFDNADQLQAIYNDLIAHQPGNPESYRNPPPVLGGDSSTYDPDANSLFMTSFRGDFMNASPGSGEVILVNTSVTESNGTSHTKSKTETTSKSVSVISGAFADFWAIKAEVTQKFTNKWSHIEGSAYSTAFSDQYKGATAIDANNSYAGEHNMASRVIVGTAFVRHDDSDECMDVPASPSSSDTLTACPTDAMLVVTNQLISPDD